MLQSLMSAELNTSSGRMNGGVSSLLTSEKVEGKSKLSLVELVAPVSEDLQLLNDNLQKVKTLTDLILFGGIFTLCVGNLYV